MKSRIFMYLFIFSVLLIIFQYVNSKSIIDEYEKDIKTFKSKISNFEDEQTLLNDKIFDLSNFSINGNEEAITYFEDLGINTDELILKLKDGLLEMNAHKGLDHPIIPYASMTESRIIIDQIRILNHKWILTSFTDGKHSGELFINYRVNDKGELAYKLTDYFLYPIN
ncbi:hydrolase [uncultured Winogradskyella sp.]|uniref:hydrolase n=1 Tax=uncultured Winogradskyella sp. TaxID=395353 RepID=UPI00260E469D|nr:hydrolase [uncultured Winogradskyella sp.]